MMKVNFIDLVELLIVLLCCSEYVIFPGAVNGPAEIEKCIAEYSQNSTAGNLRAIKCQNTHGINDPFSVQIIINHLKYPYSFNSSAQHRHRSPDTDALIQVEIQRKKHKLELSANDTTELFCKFIVSPRAKETFSFNLTWFRYPPKKSLKDSSSLSIIEKEDGLNLVISQLQPEDAGTYTCQAISTEGSLLSQDSIELSLQNGDYVSPIDQKEFTNTKLALVGNNIELKCQLGSSKSNTSWSRQNADLPVNSAIIDRNLWFRNLSTKDAGIYDCSSGAKHSDKEESFKATINLIVEDYPVTNYLNETKAFLNSDSQIRMRLTLRPQQINQDILVSERTSMVRSQDICFNISSLSENGTVFYQGPIFDPSNGQTIGSSASSSSIENTTSIQQQTSQREMQDFFAIFLVDGCLFISYDLGSGLTNLLSTLKINDGLEHRIRVLRNGKVCSVYIDGKYDSRISSRGKYTMLNANVDFVLGRAPVDVLKSNSKLSVKDDIKGFIGCVKNLKINGIGPLNLYRKELTSEIVHSIDVNQCHSPKSKSSKEGSGRNHHAVAGSASSIGDDDED